MKNYLIYYVFITLSIIVNSCSEGFKEEYSKFYIVLKEVTAITTPTTDTTPDYTFSSNESGAITYGGSCSSSTTIAISGNNTITLSSLSDGTYADCTIKVSKTMKTNKSKTNLSGSLTITSFTIITSTDNTTLSAPSGLTATGTAGQVSLDWSAVTSANSYTVYWDNATGISSSSTAITSVSNDNYTHSSLDNGSTYYYKVAAVDTDNTTGSLSSEVSAATPLPAPDNLSASGANNTIILTWNSVSGATSYTLYWDNVSGIDNSDTAITSITNDNYTDSNKETNYALDFDGSNDYVAADGVTSELSSTGLPFTVSAWAYPDTTTRGAIFAFNKKGTNAHVNRNLLFYAKNGSTKKFYHWDRGSNSWTESENTFEPGEWHHIVEVVDSSGNGKLYVNGGLEAEWSNGNNSSADRFSIGQEYDGTGSTASDYFNGKIDEVAVWNVALSAADVTALYNSGNGLKASANSGNYDNSGDLVGYWKFNEGTGSTLTDSTSNSNNGTLTNMDSSSDWVNTGMDNGSIYYYKVAAVNSSGTGTLSSVASAILAQRIQASETFNGHTYALTSAAMTWAQAKVIATALGGYLTTINTKAENDWLTTRFRIQHNATLWIGANDIATTNTWVWDNGTTSGDSGLTDDLSSNATWADDSTRKWESGEPNHSGGSCGYIWQTSGTWDDVACTATRYAIIEFD